MGRKKTITNWPIQITMKISEELNDRLLAFVGKENTDKTKVCRRAIEMYLNVMEQEFDNKRYWETLTKMTGGKVTF